MATKKKSAKAAKQDNNSAVVVVTQSIETSARDAFEEFHEKLVAFAQKNGHKKPKKGDVLSHLIKHSLKTVTEKNYFR